MWCRLETGYLIWSLDRVTWWGLERFEKSEMSWGETEQSSWLSTFGCLRACRNRNQKSCREKHGFHLWVCRWNPYVFHLFSDFYQKACPDDVFHSFSDSHQKIVTRSKTQFSLVGRERVEWPDIGMCMTALLQTLHNISQYSTTIWRPSWLLRFRFWHSQDISYIRHSEIFYSNPGKPSRNY